MVGGGGLGVEVRRDARGFARGRAHVYVETLEFRLSVVLPSILTNYC